MLVTVDAGNNEFTLNDLFYVRYFSSEDIGVLDCYFNALQFLGATETFLVFTQFGGNIDAEEESCENEDEDDTNDTEWIGDGVAGSNVMGVNADGFEHLSCRSQSRRVGDGTGHDANSGLGRDGRVVEHQKSRG